MLSRALHCWWFEESASTSVDAKNAVHREKLLEKLSDAEVGEKKYS